MANEKQIICCKCNKELVQQKVVLTYMEFDFNLNMPTCPECGAVFISKEIATGRMAEVEMMLEEK